MDGELKITMIDHEADHGCVADVLVKREFRLLQLREEEVGLEEVFLRLTGEAHEPVSDPPSERA